MRQYVLVCTGMYWYVLVCPGMFWYVLVCTGMYQQLLWFPIHQFRPSPLLDTWRYIKVHGSTWQYRKVLYTWIMAVLQGTWQYKALYLDVPRPTFKGNQNYQFEMDLGKVLYTWIMAVLQGTWQYKALYLDVPRPTLMYRLHSGIQDFLVLPCTSMYLHVSSNGEGWNWWIGNQSKCWYILVHTSTYQYIPVHTVSY